MQAYEITGRPFILYLLHYFFLRIAVQFPNDYKFLIICFIIVSIHGLAGPNEFKVSAQVIGLAQVA